MKTEGRSVIIEGGVFCCFHHYRSPFWMPAEIFSNTYYATVLKINWVTIRQSRHAKIDRTKLPFGNPIEWLGKDSTGLV